MPELGPPARVHADCRAQINFRMLEALRTHVVPPFEIVRVPCLQRAQQLLVGAEIDIVGDGFVVVDLDEAVGA